jgi:hypothetical protein
MNYVHEHMVVLTNVNDYQTKKFLLRFEALLIMKKPLVGFKKAAQELDTNS